MAGVFASFLYGDIIQASPSRLHLKYPNRVSAKSLDARRYTRLLGYCQAPLPELP